jgi:hypothetical protein
VGRSWNELRFLAADRQNWKELIDNLCSRGTTESIIIYRLDQCVILQYHYVSITKVY